MGAGTTFRISNVTTPGYISSDNVERGVSVARNVGIGRARAELVAFLDDDDRMLPDRLKLQVRAMSDESIGLCHTQFRFIDGSGAVTGTGLAREAQYRDFLMGNGVVLLSSVVARRSLIQEVGGFNSVLAIGEDLDLVFRIARECTVSFLPDVLCEYRRHGNNIWLGATSGGREIKQILTQHLWSAELRNRAEDAKAARIGLATALTGRANAAMFRASEARYSSRSKGPIARSRRVVRLFSGRLWEGDPQSNSARKVAGVLAELNCSIRMSLLFAGDCL